MIACRECIFDSAALDLLEAALDAIAERIGIAVDKARWPTE
jgi:hypothetical protein